MATAVSDGWARSGRAAPLDPLRGSLLNIVAAIATPRRLGWRGDARPRLIEMLYTINRPRTRVAVSPTDGPFAETKEQLG